MNEDTEDRAWELAEQFDREARAAGEGPSKELVADVAATSNKDMREALLISLRELVGDDAMTVRRSADHLLALAALLPDEGRVRCSPASTWCSPAPPRPVTGREDWAQAADLYLTAEEPGLARECVDAAAELVRQTILAMQAGDDAQACPLAVEHLRSALSSTTEDDPDVASHLMTYVDDLARRYHNRHDRFDLAEAIRPRQGLPACW